MTVVEIREHGRIVNAEDRKLRFCVACWFVSVFDACARGVCACACVCFEFVPV